MNLSAGVFIKNKLLTMDLCNDTLVYVNLETSEMEEVFKLGNKSHEYEVMSYDKKTNKIIIAPFLAKDFLIIDVAERIIMRINIEWDKLFGNLPSYYIKERKIGKIVIQNRIAYAIGFSVPGIICIDLLSYKYTVIDCSKYCGFYTERNGILQFCAFSYKSGIIYKNKLFIPVATKAQLLMIDINNGDKQIAKIKNCKEIIDISIADNEIYFLGTNNIVTKINHKGIQETVLDLKRKEKLLYCKIVNNNDNIYLIPFYANKFLQYNMKKKEARVLLEYNNEMQVKHIDCMTQSTRLITFFLNKSQYLIYDMRNDLEMQCKCLHFSKDQIKKKIMKNDLLYEEMVGLEEYLDYIKIFR